MWFNEYKRIVTKNGEEPLSPLGGLLGGMSAGCFSVRLVRWMNQSNIRSVVDAHLTLHFISFPFFIFSDRRYATTHSMLSRRDYKEPRPHNTQERSIVSNKLLPRKALELFMQASSLDLDASYLGKESFL